MNIVLVPRILGETEAAKRHAPITVEMVAIKLEAVIKLKYMYSKICLKQLIENRQNKGR